MRKLGLLAIVLLCFSFVACDDGITRDYWENGKLKSELRYVDGKLNGECVWYTSDGQLLSKAIYLNDTLEGHYQRWHPNGQLAVDGWYHHGLRDSVCHSFSEQGRLISEDYYRNGQLHGESKKWYDNGQIFQEGRYAEGMMDGSWFIFYPSGALAGKAEYHHGTGKQIGYDESGYKCLEVSYLNNQKHGKEIRYNPIGEIVEVVEYEHGAMVSNDTIPQDIHQ